MPPAEACRRVELLALLPGTLECRDGPARLGGGSRSVGFFFVKVQRPYAGPSSSPGALAPGSAQSPHRNLKT